MRMKIKTIEYQRQRRHNLLSKGWKYYNSILPPDLIESVKEMVRQHQASNYDTWFPPKVRTEEIKSNT